MASNTVKGYTTTKDINNMNKTTSSPFKSTLGTFKAEEAIIWMVGEDGVITFCEGDGLPLLDLNVGEMIGKSIYDVFEQSTQVEECIGKAFNGSSCHVFEEIEGFLWKIWCYPYHDATGVVIGVWLVFVNHTDQYHRDRMQQIILDLSTTLRKVEKHADMPAVILDQIMGIMVADTAMLFTRVGIKGEMRIELGRGAWSRWSGLIINEEETTFPGEQIRSVIQQGKPYIGKDTYFGLNEGDGLFVVGLPLLVQGRIIGALWIGRKRQFTEYEISLFEEIGDIVSNMIHVSTQYNTTQRRLQHLVALHNIYRAISSSLDLGVTIKVILEQVVTQLGVHAAAVYHTIPVTNNLAFVAGRGFRTMTFNRTHLQLGEGLAGKVAITRKMTYISDLREVTQGLSRQELFSREGFVSYFGVPLIVKGQVNGVMEIYHRERLNPGSEWLDFLDTLAAQAAIAVDNADLFNNLQRTNAELSVAYDSTLDGWVRALDLRDRETEGHTKRVTDLTLRLARALGVREMDIVHVRRGALLHDIGKMAIPDEILFKPGPLNDAEWEIMHKHPIYAYELLSPIRFLKPALDIPYYHHEKWDGSGYPFGLKGEQIPRTARIFAVIDVWDALRSDRPYRKAWSDNDARAYIRENAGIHFEPEIVDMFFRLF